MEKMTKSDFMASAEWMKDNLGEGLCLAKWQQVSLHLPTGLTNSCYHPPLHQIDASVLKDNPGALHNTAHKIEQRVIMLKNERPSECSYCWAQEDLGNLSDRHYRSGEPWAAEHFEEIKSGRQENPIPSYVEVNFNHACNLKCSYCSPQFSSSWADEVTRHGAYPTRNPHNDPVHFTGNRRPIPASESNPYVDAFWEWFPELYPKLKHFRMTGGEPLMDKNTYRVFDYVIANPSPRLAAATIATDDVEQVRYESTDLAIPVKHGTLSWDKIVSLGDIVAGKRAAREYSTDMTLFKSLGVAIEDVALAARAYEKALASGVGVQLPNLAG